MHGSGAAIPAVVAERVKSIPASGRAGELIVVLRQNRLLGAVSEPDLQTVIRSSQIVSVSEREPLFGEGDSGRSVVVVLEGFVKLTVMSAAGRETVLEVCGPGSMFGELAVLNGWPRAATAAGLSECRVLAIQGEAFRQLLTRSAAAMFSIIGLISRRLRHATEQVRDSADLPGPARLAKALTQLAATHSHPVANGLRIDVKLSQRELGALTGLSRETINKQLSGWRDRAWIALSDGEITLIEAEALRRLAFEGGDGED